MTSIKRAGRLTTLGFAVGAGLLIAAGAGAAVASAAPEDSGHTSAGSSSASSNSASAARSGRPSSSTTAGAKQTRAVSTRGDYSASVVQLHTRKPSSAAPTSSRTTSATATQELASPPAPSVKQASAPRVPAAVKAPQAAVDVARDLNTLHRNLELLIRHQVDDWRDNLTALRTDLAAIFGPARRPTNPDIPADETPGVIGKPRTREVYFVYQGDTNTCALSTAAMLIGQLYGRDKMPTWEQIVTEAATTSSYTTPGKPIYDRVNDTFVTTKDVVQLLATHGVEVKATDYTRGQGDLAFSNLKAALSQGDSVAVSVKAQIIWGRGAPDTAYRADHLITVLGIDTTKNLVYVNDSAFKEETGKGMAIEMKVFMSAWAADSYTTLTAVAATTSQTALTA